MNLNFEKISKAVKALVRSRAIEYGSLIAYEETGNIVKENPRTGIKIVIQVSNRDIEASPCARGVY